MMWENEEEYRETQRVAKMTPYNMVKEFHDTFEQSYGDFYDGGLEEFRWGLVEEEFIEFTGSLDPKEALKELADLVYVCYGYANTFGWDLDEAIRRVHMSNMSKVDKATGMVLYRSDGKVLKGPDYKEANMEGLV
jgi:predicted HAD superfamily Cof-like phosphohydrolase